ncbi:hypothetical protein NLI96_g7469 [Meripilus lineatus]|uniref:protein-ribulosamine 3-kinase n=1 Tax=Meripilus lineatus TaxID=2056292 RepID=A0AAD5UZB7_9APHY|nr:hypothetical protein NLI96_g7469 [Physisporinus lineatus]
MPHHLRETPPQSQLIADTESFTPQAPGESDIKAPRYSTPVFGHLGLKITMPVHLAILRAIRKEEPGATVSSSGQSSVESSSGRNYFTKVGSPSDTEQYFGEAESLKAMHIAAPGLAPRVLACATIDEDTQESPNDVGRPYFSGNTGTDRKTGEPVIFDPSSYFGHNEADLAIARIFGGFPRAFFSTYHEYKPKTEPSDQYELRGDLYQLFHCLNHTVLFGGGYAGSSEAKMDSLLKAFPK